ncbi:MAG: septum formation initiator family protein [Candidatus Spechtbacterales bacterium]
MKFLASKIGRLLIMGLVVLFAFMALRQIGVALKINSDVKTLEKKISELSAENKNIQEKTASFENPDTIDKEARTRLNLKKEGEHVVVLLPPDKQDYEDQFAPEEASPDDASFWHKIMSWFGF